MIAKTTAQRVAKVAEAKRESGLKQVRSLWAHPDDHPEIREHAAKLARKRERVQRKDAHKTPEM